MQIELDFLKEPFNITQHPILQLRILKLHFKGMEFKLVTHRMLGRFFFLLLYFFILLLYARGMGGNRGLTFSLSLTHSISFSVPIRLFILL